jgi:hypothetical protein
VKWWQWVLAALLAVIVGGTAYLAITGTDPVELAELMLEDGEKQLREPMRPLRGGTRVLVLAIDGVGDEPLRRALRENTLSHLARVVGAGTDEPDVYASGYAVPGALSILPSTTYAAWASVFTGKPVGHTGIAGNEWFVREERRFYAPAPVSVTGNTHALQVYTDNLIGAALRVPTLFERADVRAYVSLASVHQGADLLITPDLRLLGQLVTAAAEGITGGDAPSQEAYERLDRSTTETLLERLRRDGVPDLQVVYFPGVDLFTHVAETPLAEMQRYLAEVLDPAIGAILDEYRRQGALEQTYILVVSDHGHTPVIGSERHALGVDLDDDPPAVLRNAGFRLRPFELEQDEDHDFQATVAYQGAIAYVYLADRSTCPHPGDVCDWARAPRLQEDVLPVVRAFAEASRTGAGAPGMRGTLDLIFAREPRPPGIDAEPFQLWDGTRLRAIGDVLAASPRPDLLDLENRLHALATGPYGHRAGDVLLLARSGQDRPIADRFYFSHEYHSWHGSPARDDSHIAFLLARSGTSGSTLRDQVRTVTGARPSQLHITPLILHLLAR